MESPASPQTAQQLPLIATRKCTSCGTVLKRFAITGLYMPVEQWAIPWQQAVEESIQHPIRPWGLSSVHELVFLGYRSVCPTCGHIDMWYISHKEVEAIIAKSATPDSEGYGIDWYFNPELMKQWVEKVPDFLKGQFEPILKYFENLQNPK